MFRFFETQIDFTRRRPTLRRRTRSRASQDAGA
jgi:hypothetical protein